MKFLLPLVFAATTAVSGFAHAATYASDADRRSQNREEALSKWRASSGQPVARTTTTSTTTRTSADKPTMRERTKDGARSVKNFTHRQAESVRNFGERQDRRLGAKFGKRANTNAGATPEGGGGGK